MILDNGRSRVRETPYRSVLNCIRCGACQNVCPVYRQVGGTAYGWVYGGPIGAVLTPLLHGDQELGHASSLCAACDDVCPVKIPLHELLLGLRRDRAADSAGRSSGSRFGSGASPGAGRGSSASPSGSPAGPAGRCPLLRRWTRTRDLEVHR